LNAIGQIVEKELLALPSRYSYATIDKYMIMPTHLHAIIRLEGNIATASSRPTLMDIICTLKSLTTRKCNQNNHLNGCKIWQASFYEKVIRNEKSYAAIWEYIDENPINWEKDEYYNALP
jgi:REP element-mobilizing transposase RayT